MPADLRDRLTALRELEPSDEDLARLRSAPAPRRRRRTPLVAIAGVAAAAAGVAFALPGTAPTPLQAAAAAAAAQDGPADFEGYRYVEVLDRQRSPWAVPEDGDCIKPATPDAATAPECEMKYRAAFVEEGRQELWIDARWRGIRRDHGSEIVEATGDRPLVEAIRKEFGRTPSREPYEYGDGAFARVPLAQLPTDPDALVDTLRAAYADGRWAENPATYSRSRLDEGSRLRELALFTIHLLAESNATPALRAAGFGALSRMDGVTDLGTVRDARGRRGQGVEIRSTVDYGGTDRPSAARLIFDERTGEVLAWSEAIGSGDERIVHERVLLHTEHVDSIPGEG